MRINLCLLAVVILAVRADAQGPYEREEASNHAHLWRCDHNTEEYCYSDVVPGSDWQAIYFTAIMQHGRMGWCDNWVWGEDLDPVINPSTEPGAGRCIHPLNCPLPRHSSLISDLNLYTIFNLGFVPYNPSGFWEIIDGASPATDYATQPTPLLQGQIIAFTNCLANGWQWEPMYFFVYSDEGTVDGVRQFDAVLHANLFVWPGQWGWNCNNYTIGQLLTDAALCLDDDDLEVHSVLYVIDAADNTPMIPDPRAVETARSNQAEGDCK